MTKIILTKIKKFFLNHLNAKIKKIALFSFLIAITVSFVVLFIYWPRDMSKGIKPIYGLNFSQKYATDLGLDWEETYIHILDELKPKRLRISAHWDLIEQKKGIYDFTDLDWQITEAAKRDIQVILAIGRRTPRWPECHPPVWAKPLTEEAIEPLIMALLKEEIKYFESFDNIIYWQIENEPFLDIFGDCPDGNEKLLDKEIALVNSISDKPIMVTDSGELSTWRKMADKGNILGTSMYKTVWNPYWKFFTYPIPSSYYYYKAKINQYFNKNLEKVIVSELQGEAWGNAPLPQIPLNEQYRSMNADKLKNNIEYARRSGLPEIYVWGAEWWYWVKKQGNNSFWEIMKDTL